MINPYAEFEAILLHMKEGQWNTNNKRGGAVRGGYNDNDWFTIVYIESLIKNYSPYRTNGKKGQSA